MQKKSLLTLGDQIKPRLYKGARLGAGNIGIFWSHNGTLLPFPVDPYGSHSDDSGDFVDSTLSHWKVWDRALIGQPALRDCGYEEIPRGRVLFKRWERSRDYGTFIIYASTSIQRDANMKLQILKAFNLDHLALGIKNHDALNHRIFWATDEHYEPPELIDWKN